MKPPSPRTRLDELFAFLEARIDYEQTTEVPADYRPPEALPAGATGELIRKELSVEERRRVEQDPVVRQTMDLFDGIVINVERRATTPVREEAE